MFNFTPASRRESGLSSQTDDENASTSPDQPECIARLVVCGNSGHSTLPKDASINEHFHVNAIELLKIDLVEDCKYSNRD